MCLLAFAWRVQPEFPLVLVGNRDEFHDRPAEPAHWWPAPEGILAGRDLQAGGSWLGVSQGGRFAVVTNYREPGTPTSGRRSRGELVVDPRYGTRASTVVIAGADGEIVLVERRFGVDGGCAGESRFDLCVTIAGVREADDG